MCWLEKKVAVMVAAAVTAAVVRACVGGGKHLLGVGSNHIRGRARVRVAARRSIPFLAPGFRRLKMTHATTNALSNDDGQDERLHVPVLRRVL